MSAFKTVLVDWFFGVFGAVFTPNFDTGFCYGGDIHNRISRILAGFGFMEGSYRGACFRCDMALKHKIPTFDCRFPNVRFRG